MMWSLQSSWKKRLPSVISVGVLYMLKGNPALMMLYYLSFFTVIGVREIAHENFREAVIRLLAILRVRGKSGHHRAGFPTKAGGLVLRQVHGQCHRK